VGNPYEDDLDDIRFGYIDDDDIPCDHEEYDVDWEGRATCDSCHHSWWLTPEEHAAYDKMMIKWAADFDRQMHREEHWFWRRWDIFMKYIRLILTPPYRVKSYNFDDELPF
jgi:hypothetical protein